MTTSDGRAAWDIRLLIYKDEPVLCDTAAAGRTCPGDCMICEWAGQDNRTKPVVWGVDILGDDSPF